MNQSSGQLAPPPKTDPKIHALANLRQSVWDASQYMTFDQIETFVSRVLDEIAADEP